MAGIKVRFGPTGLLAFTVAFAFLLCITFVRATTSLAMATHTASSSSTSCIMYLTGQHDVLPDEELLQPLTHIILAFLPSHIFNEQQAPSTYPLFRNVSSLRSEIASETKVMVAIGGWGDTKGFEDAAATSGSRDHWAKMVAEMVETLGVDGVDIDWEYPGGNRDDYKEVPNSEREWEVEAYVSLLASIRTHLPKGTLLSAAVPGKEDDLMAFTASTVPRIVEHVDFLNVMTYDLMNRRNTAVKHHSGALDSRDSVTRYVERGCPAEKINLGLGYYVKWFLTTQCPDPENPIGCETQLLEDPDTGADLGRTGGFSWHDEIPEELRGSFARAIERGKFWSDSMKGSYGYWDAEESRWWSFDTSEVVAYKMDKLVGDMGLGGVFAWGLGEDAPTFDRLKATVEGVKRVNMRVAQEQDKMSNVDQQHMNGGTGTKEEL